MANLDGGYMWKPLFVDELRQRMVARPIRFIMLSILIQLSCLSGIARGTDEKAEPQQALKDVSFASLQEERDQLERSIQDRESTLNSVKATLDWRRLEGERKATLEAIRKRGNATKEAVEAAEKDFNTAHDNAGYPKTDAELNKDFENATTQLESAKKRKKDIDSEFSRRVDIEAPKQSFRTNMSIAFAILVALVIVGFYLLAWIDEALRREMFSRQSGIQFITLFSLVIAIILFGITGILESRELSALLGGLSGYILGRSGDGPRTVVSAEGGQKTAPPPTNEGNAIEKPSPGS
jgi:hypothetical protein